MYAYINIKKKKVNRPIQLPFLTSGVFPLGLRESRIKPQFRKVLQSEV